MSGSGLSNADLEVRTFWLPFDAENRNKSHSQRHTCTQDLAGFMSESWNGSLEFKNMTFRKQSDVSHTVLKLQLFKMKTLQCTFFCYSQQSLEDKTQPGNHRTRGLTVFLWPLVPIGPLNTPLMLLSCPSRRWVELITM